LVQRSAITACLIVLGALAPGRASAQSSPQVVGVDGRAWPQIVEGLAADLTSQGTAVPLCVRSSSAASCAPCGAYRLELTDSAAFRLDACDEHTGLTTARLVDRSALFDHSGAIPVPRATSLSVAMIGRSGVVTARPQVGGSAESCSVRVHPFVRDLEHGETIYLDPSEYAVRVAASSVHVDATDEGGFVLWSTDRAESEISYDVVERATGAIVVVGHATLDCTSAIDVPAIAMPIDAPLPLAQPDRGRSLRAPRQSGGIFVHERDEHLDASRVLAITGLSLAAASAITLLAEAIADPLERAPECLEYATTPAVTLYGSSMTSTPPSPTCRRSTGPRASHVPAELTWAALGGLGIGALLGTIGVLLLNTLPDDAPQLAFDFGPSGGSISATVRF
jgi:hypothetical protein